MSDLILFAQNNDGAASMVSLVIMLGILFFVLAGVWKTFEKAGEPGWASIIPIYNVVVMCRIAGKPEWWVILMLIPIVNMIVSIMVMVGIAENFGKGIGYALGLIFFGFIFFPLLGFGDAVYEGGSAEAYDAY